MTDSRTVPPWARVPLLTAALAGTALLLAVAALPGVETAGLDLPWWTLLPFFALAEVLVVHLQYRRDEVLTLSFAEIPLVLGLAFVSPLGFIAANVLGSALALVLHRRQRGLKLAFNVALMALEACLALSLYHLLLGDAAPHDPQGLAAALATIVVTDLVSAAAITAVIALDTGTFEPEVLVESVTTGLMAALTNTSVALLVVVALRYEPSALLLLIPVLGVLLLCYRSYTTLSTGHLRLEHLYRFTRGIGRAVPLEQVLREVLEQVQDVLGAERSELVLPAAAGSPARHLRLANGRVEEVPGLPGWWSPALSGETVLRSRRDDPTLPVRNGLAAPLRLDDGLVGVLLVANRAEHLPDFTAAELPLISSLANHAAVALQNARLVDQLTAEAAVKAHQALHDELTGLPNRRALLLQLEADLEDSRGGSLVVVLGLDGFQDINEALGRETGDLLLIEVGRRLVSALPEAGCVSRLSGDEFAFLLRNDGAGDAGVTSAVRTAVQPLRSAFAIRGLDIDVRASVGIAYSPEHGDSPTSLLQRAEAAMYVAKRDNTRSEVFDPLTDHGSARRLQLTAALRTAVHERSLDVHYQPKVEPTTGAVLGAEALVRWTHPRLGAVSPEELIPLAEYTGLIDALTDFVLESALTQCRRWHDSGWPMTVAVNLSARSLSDESLPDRVVALLHQARLPAWALTFEITESAVMADPDRALVVLDRLRVLGLRLSVDDFGTGQSSLTYLKRLPVDEVKIDRSFVAGMLADPADLAIVRHTLGLIHELGLIAVAEGVEDVPTQHQLAAWGCDAVQGFLVSRPLPAGEFASWLGRQEAQPKALPTQKSGLGAVPARRGERRGRQVL